MKSERLKSRVSKIYAEKFFIGSNPNLLPIHTHSSVQAFSNRSNSRSKTDFFKFGSNIFRSILSFDFDRYIASFYCPDPFLSFERILKVFSFFIGSKFSSHWLWALAPEGSFLIFQGVKLTLRLRTQSHKQITYNLGSITIPALIRWNNALLLVKNSHGT